MKALQKFIRKLQEEKGQTTIEYILVIVLVALVLIIAVTQGGLDTAINSAVDKIVNAIQNVP